MFGVGLLGWSDPLLVLALLERRQATVADCQGVRLLGVQSAKVGQTPQKKRPPPQLQLGVPQEWLGPLVLLGLRDSGTQL